MARTIEISTDVYARIWALRHDGEESESDILWRVLGDPGANSGSDLVAVNPTIRTERSMLPVQNPATYTDRGPKTWSQPTWATDIADVLKQAGGRLRLNQLYNRVEKFRQAANRTVPRSLEATIRRTLENHSSDSKNYTGGADIFFMPEGKGAGFWALREKYL